MAKIRKNWWETDEGSAAKMERYQRLVAARKDKYHRKVDVSVLGKKYWIVFDEYEKKPQTEEEIAILAAQLEEKAANGELKIYHYYPEEGYRIEIPDYEFLRHDAAEKVPEHLRSTGQAAEEADRRCLIKLKRNAVTRAASWNNARDSNVL